MSIKEKLEAGSKDPFNRLLARLKLGESDTSGVARKVLIFPIITWLPLLIITYLEGNSLNPELKISFLTDYSTYAKLLITLPVIFLAGNFINYMTINSVEQFIEAHIIHKDEIGIFEKISETYLKLQNSWIIEIVIFLVGVAKLFFSGVLLASFGEENSWKYFLNNGREWTVAGYWFALICLPILQYLIFRLFWRFIIWAWFLWKVSRMNLHLVASDPDMSGGLAFLGTTQLSFGLLGFAQSCSLASEIANKAIYSGVSIDEFKVTTLISIPLLALIYLSPLFFFTRKLLFTKLHGMWEFGILTHKYSSMFIDKWVKGNNPEKEPFLGTGDIQSLADIGGSSEVINNMRLVPMNIRVPVGMLLMIAIPFLPLLLLKFPASEILKSLMGFVF